MELSDKLEEYIQALKKASAGEEWLARYSFIAGAVSVINLLLEKHTLGEQLASVEAIFILTKEREYGSKRGQEGKQKGD